MNSFIDSKIFFYIALVGRIFLFIALFYSIAIGSVETPIIGSFISLSLAPLFLKNRLNHFYDFLFMVVIVFNTSSFIWDAYGMVDYYDGIVHFVTPFLLVILTGHFVAKIFKNLKKNKLPIIFLLGGFGMLLGASWEIIEWVSENTFLPYSVMFGLTDTMSDIMLDFVGALAGAAVYVYLLANKKGETIKASNFPLRRALLCFFLSFSVFLLLIGV